MILDRITMTGADDSVNINDLCNLSLKYPFVEWGILVSKTNKSGIRFPSVDWLIELYAEMYKEQFLKLSCHICGQFVEDLMIGNNTIEYSLPFLLSIFNRIQLNTHAEKTELTVSGANMLATDPVFCNKQIILQFDEVNNDNYKIAKQERLNAVPLFDLSHGAGILPDSWPEPISLYCGYAGGLGPENLEEQLLKIQKMLSNTNPNQRIWIDMETKVRSNDDKQFDLVKVEECLKIAQKFMGKT